MEVAIVSPRIDVVGEDGESSGRVMRRRTLGMAHSCQEGCCEIAQEASDMGGFDG